MFRLFLPCFGYLFFFSKSRVFPVFIYAENYNYLRIRYSMHPRKQSRQNLVDKIKSDTRNVMSSNPAQNILFIFKTRV